MSGYQRTCDAWVSSSWQDHKSRNPPSSEPGTDYACGYGTVLLAPWGGWVVDAKTSNGSATGRYLTMDLDDGRRVRFLHLASILVGVGGRVERGAGVAVSGASAYGSDWGVGAHVHVTLFPGHSYDFNNTLDFDAHVGEPTPPPPPPHREEDIMAYSIVPLDDGGIWLVSLVNGNRVHISEPYHVGLLQRVKENNGADLMLTTEVNIVDGYLNRLANPAADPAKSDVSPLVTPAWIAGLFLGLIGLVEVVRFVVDLLI